MVGRAVALHDWVRLIDGWSRSSFGLGIPVLLALLGPISGYLKQPVREEGLRSYSVLT